jgi:hypothetical protein
MRLLRGLGGRVLPCGCLVGIYETYENQVVATIDAPGVTCAEPEHRLHYLVPVDEIDAATGVDAPSSHPHPRA